MTAEILPPIVSSTFGKRFDTDPYSLPESGPIHSASATACNPSVSNALLQHPRQASPASILSFASVPLPPNNENLAPLCQYASVSQASLHSVSTSHAPSCLQRSQIQSRDTHARPATSAAALRHSRQARPSEDEDHRLVGGVSSGDVSLLQSALEGIEIYKSARSGTVASSAQDTLTDLKAKSGEHNCSPITKRRTSGVVSAQRDVSPNPAGTTSTRALDPAVGISSSSPSEQTPLEHRKRLSTNSSGFVHTVKTASFSNGSFSLMSKSPFFGRSSETHALLSSHSRFSTDSERPATNSSLDESALRRRVRRRQIMEEMITTEETYIADLKALVYLMSTLLASASSISSRLRHSMQLNVLDILHLHERILERLHRAAFKAAARKWAEMISPRGSGSPGHSRWRSLEPSEAGRLARIHRRTRSSMESHDLSRTRARLVGAEEADVADLVEIFKSSVNNFFAYEEYCANHEIIAHDLQRHLPTLWSTYEAGIESLARSLIALDRRDEGSRKALTVGDLLIKPIQRICKYPLLFEDLLKQTPVSDCPSAHTELDTLLQSLRDIVDAVNHATHSEDTRLHIHRRWSLQARLNFGRVTLLPENFRLLGNAILCGVLHVTFHTRHRVDGAYALCVLYHNALLVAFPAGVAGRFDIMALISLSDLKIESASDGKGLQSPSALHTWKLCFVIEGNLHEFVLSACSVVEEEQWRRGLRGELTTERKEEIPNPVVQSSVALELKSVGVVYGHHGTLARRLSVQRAATAGNRASVYQVIVRNTHNPEELHEFRQPSTSAINRSHSHMTTNRIVVLAPKRSERARLESMLNDVWTKDKLPYPGMIASRGGQIIRASAGSLVRKLSLASIHAPFSRRSASLTVSSRKSYETFSETTRLTQQPAPTFEIRRDSFEDRTVSKPVRKPSHDLPELDTMDRVVNRMIGDTKRLSCSPNDGIKKNGALHKQPIHVTALPIGPDDPAEAFYPEEVEKKRRQVSVEEALTGSKKRRWSNPFGLLKGLSGEGFRHMLYSSK